ncbi:cyclin-dependent kinase F-4-like [Mangifera indica]|uniref:cyclin-dependent kinase F-4-like n=1 Tax=Mangifera indica TaxID=29780 RepID=UPI001CFAD1D0|nr:cyclin-dependent kinase F-4-like [Mangifera indica]
MENFQAIQPVGEGAYGEVWKAFDQRSGEVVAIKKLRRSYYSWKDCMNLREVKSLSKMKHPNIVKLQEVIKQHDSLYFVFEYMETNLNRIIRQRKSFFTNLEVRSWCFQILLGLNHMHQKGYFHRDLKPENLLVSENVMKIADFGMVKEIDSEPSYTEYVTTRWYRAPEVILKSSNYNSKVDMWAVGAIMAEMYALHPIFPGKDAADQMFKICRVLGSPTQETWPEGLVLARSLGYQFPELPGVNLSKFMPSASEDAISFISWLCSWDPLKRPTAAQALQHPFFRNNGFWAPVSFLGAPPGFEVPRRAMKMENKVSDFDKVIGPRKLQCAGRLKPHLMMKTGVGLQC